MKRTLTAIIAIVATAFAEDTEFSVPVIGYVFDGASKQIRPLTGTPGAAVAGRGISIDGADTALVAKDGAFAVISSANADSLSIIRRTGSTTESISLSGVPSAFDAGALSPGAEAAIVYTAQCNCVRVLSDLGTDPKLRRTIPLMESSEVRAVGINDRATTAAISVKVAGESKLLIYAAESDMPSALTLSSSALAFDGAGEKLLVADEHTQDVYLISDLIPAPTLSRILSAADGLKAPVSVGVGPDSSVIVGDAETGVYIWSSSDGTTRHVECACRPTTVQRTATSGMYRISDAETGAVWILQLDGEMARTFFVPVVKESSNAVGEGTR
jgi:hypothetical protein